MALNSLGSSTRELGDYDEAVQLFEKSLELFREIGHKRWISACFDGLGRTYLKIENLSSARDYLHQALNTALEIQSLPDVMSALYSLALLAVSQRCFFESAVIVNFVIQHPASKALVHKRSQKLMVIATAELSPTKMVEAQERGQLFNLQQAIEFAQDI